MLGFYWEPKKPKHLREEKLGPLGACCLTSLAANNSSAYLYSLLFAIFLKHWAARNRSKEVLPFGCPPAHTLTPSLPPLLLGYMNVQLWPKNME
jgi:hypothetical protein